VATIRVKLGRDRFNGGTTMSSEPRFATMIGLLVLVVLLVVFDLLALRFGTDSRVHDARRWMI